MNIILFDDNAIKNFYPLTETRVIGDLRCGILKLRQRLVHLFNIETTNYLMPQYLEEIYKERHPDWEINNFPESSNLYINSRLKANKGLVRKIKKMDNNLMFTWKGEIVAFKADKNLKTFDQILGYTNSFKKQALEGKLLWEYNWELINENSAFIISDFEEHFYDKDNYFETEMGVTILDPYQVWIGEGTTLAPGVVIDASSGPVVIDENVKVMPNAVIIGPCYIGKKSIIKVGAKIYEGSSIGPVCKIGGEIEETIIQGYSNKQHDGFLGHSYLGEWVNLGADTNNSDLKNNYESVQMHFYPSGNSIDSNTNFLGCVIGDHAKTGINVSINTGCVIGVASNVYGRDLLTKFIPDFSWGESSNLVHYKPEKFLKTAAKVKERRGLAFSDKEKVLYNKIASGELA